MGIREIGIAGFTRVRVEGACSVDILRSDSYGVVVPQEDYGHVKFREEGDTLVITRKGIASLFFHARPRAIVTMPELSELTLTGASHGKVLGFQTDRELFLNLDGASHLEMNSMAAGNIRIRISGASHLSGEVKANHDARLDITGASWMELTGSGENARIAISGASQARLANFILNNSDVHVSGASSANLKVNKKLDLNISGASRLEYAGSPSLGKVSVSGASTLKQR